MKVVIAERAKLEVRQRREWWNKKRDIKQVFDEELREARRILKDAPKLAVHESVEGWKTVD